MALCKVLTSCLQLCFGSFTVAPEIACPICSCAAVSEIFSADVALDAAGKTTASLVGK